PVEWRAILPEVILVIGAVVVMVVGALDRRRRWPGLYGVLTIVTVAAALAATRQLWEDVGRKGPRLAIAQAVVVDGFSVFFTVLRCCAIVLAVLLADGYL